MFKKKVRLLNRLKLTPQQKIKELERRLKIAEQNFLNEKDKIERSLKFWNSKL